MTSCQQTQRSRTRENNVLKEVEEGMRLLDEEEGVWPDVASCDQTLPAVTKWYLVWQVATRPSAPGPGRTTSSKRSRRGWGWWTRRRECDQMLSAATRCCQLWPDCASCDQVLFGMASCHHTQGSFQLQICHHLLVTVTSYQLWSVATRYGQLLLTVTRSYKSNSTQTEHGEAVGQFWSPQVHNNWNPPTPGNLIILQSSTKPLVGKVVNQLCAFKFHALFLALPENELSVMTRFLCFSRSNSMQTVLANAKS